MTLPATDRVVLLELARWNEINAQAMVEVLIELRDPQWHCGRPGLTHGSILGTVAAMVRVGACYQAHLGCRAETEPVGDRQDVLLRRLQGINRRWVELFDGARSEVATSVGPRPSTCLAFWCTPFGHAQRLRAEILSVLPSVWLDESWGSALGLD